MDLRKTLHIHSHEKRKKGDTARLAAQLAPLEEQNQSAAQQLTNPPGTAEVHGDQGFSAIVVDKDGLVVPTGIMEGGDENTYLGMEPVVIVILGVMLIFIAFIAWQITLMPME
ncbi:MAG TPA: hypothetical protein VNO50_00640 [Pyrinomonadaceae bacterium]|nr:hypothetical protein [Pyrinomonadaceae bacterium]